MSWRRYAAKNIGLTGTDLRLSIEVINRFEATDNTQTY